MESVNTVPFNSSVQDAESSGYERDCTFTHKITCSHNKTLASKGKICSENLMVYPNLSTKCLIYFRKHLDTV
jgi:hypothetical protein